MATRGEQKAKKDYQKEMQKKEVQRVEDNKDRLVNLAIAGGVFAAIFLLSKVGS